MSTTVEGYSNLASRIVAQNAEDFHIRAIGSDGDTLCVPVSFQMATDREAFGAGKATPTELANAAARLMALTPLRSDSELKDLIIGNRLGTDCSNFVFHAQAALHAVMFGTDYASTVYRDSVEVVELADSKSSWSTSDENLHHLASVSSVSVGWIAKAFDKDPQFVAGSSHLTSPDAAVHVEPSRVLPGDIVALTKLGHSATCHVGVVQGLKEVKQGYEVNLWHSLWQEDESLGGIRNDAMLIRRDGSFEYGWSTDAHDRMMPRIVRPAMLASHVAELNSVA